jgi:hypothetical protein
LPAARLGGFYFFLDPENEDGLGGLSYIGIADSELRPIRERIVDRLRDDSALDVNLDSLEAEVARAIVIERLTCALPTSGANYVDKHLRVATLFRRSPLVVLVGCDQSKQLIREAEKLLISAASAAGAPLANIQHLHFRGSASRQGMALALDVISKAAPYGLTNGGARIWADKIAAVVSRIA